MQEQEGEVLEQQSQQKFNAFDWHPLDDSRIVAASSDGVLSEVLVTERMAPSWSNEHCLVWPRGGRLRFVTPSSNEVFRSINDISVVMQERVRGDPGSGREAKFIPEGSPVYGACEELSENVKFLPEGSHVGTAWSWLHECGVAMQDPSFKKKFPPTTTYPGVRSILGLNKSSIIFPKSEAVQRRWNMDHQTSNVRPRRIFTSDNREKAQRICGWSMDSKDLGAFVERCEKRHEFARAAAVATFCLEIRLALAILERGARKLNQMSSAEASGLNMTAISLSGFSEDRNNMWSEMVKANLTNIKDPYLRAMFAFLIVGESDAYGQVLDEPGLKLADKIAFSCQYLSDELLTANLNRCWHDLLAKGDLTGVVLSGMEEEALDLIQRYLDLTGDVQTACWLTVRCLPPQLAMGMRCQSWFDSYGDLLDSWRLFVERCDFSIAVNDAMMTKHPPQQVYISCNFCGANVGQFLKGPQVPGTPGPCGPGQEGRHPPSLHRQGSSSKKPVRAQACPNCRKPLPRCAVCLHTMGSHTGDVSRDIAPAANAKPISSFDNFFTWCQTCRHGGHAGHITGWFESHKECPVAGCACNCGSLDQDCLTLPNIALAGPPHGLLGLNGEGGGDQDDIDLSQLLGPLKSVANQSEWNKN